MKTANERRFVDVVDLVDDVDGDTQPRLTEAGPWLDCWMNGWVRT